MSYPGPNAPMHSSRPAPGDWPIQAPMSRRPQGTPLGRIVAGVFLGLLAWTIFMGIAATILVIAIGNQISDAIDDAGASTSLSDGCKAALDAGGDGSTGACDKDDTTEILRYQVTK